MRARRPAAGKVGERAGGDGDEANIPSWCGVGKVSVDRRFPCCDYDGGFHDNTPDCDIKLFYKIQD